MNYLKVYCNLIRKAENRTPPEGYTEKHHTFPISIFGKNNRVVILTAREHYIAHALLEKAFIKRYGLKHWKTIKMNFAHISMKGNNRNYFNCRLYESAKKRRSESIKGLKFCLGFRHTAETRKKLSQIRKGLGWWNNGVVDIRSKECPGKEWKKGRLKVQFGRIYNEKTKRKISDSNKGRKLTKAHKEQIGKSLRGKKRPKHGEKIKGNFNYFLKKGIIYEVISPFGEIGYTCRLQKFCDTNKLDRGAVGKVINYQYKHHKGWIINKIS